MNASGEAARGLARSRGASRGARKKMAAPLPNSARSRILPATQAISRINIYKNKFPYLPGLAYSQVSPSQVIFESLPVPEIPLVLEIANPAILLAWTVRGALHALSFTKHYLREKLGTMSQNN